MATWSPARRLSLLIAVGIGLHNATEGFGIVGPTPSSPLPEPEALDLTLHHPKVYG